ncbi:MAG: hypothetical protein GY756_04840 [bacterium]|nr:hypothetical protein [bacterium]
MNKEEIKILVGELLNEGISLSDIQKKLQNDHEVKMTFFDLRLLASELESIDWSKQKADIKAAKAAKKAEEEKEKAAKDAENSDEISSGTVVEVSKLTRPGSVANGSVKFASGAKAEWILDQAGRLALDKSEGEPTEEDIQEFQAELQKVLSNGGM